MAKLIRVSVLPATSMGAWLISQLVEGVDIGSWTEPVFADVPEENLEIVESLMAEKGYKLYRVGESNAS